MVGSEDVSCKPTSLIRKLYHDTVAEYSMIYGEKTTVAMMCGSMYNFFDDQARISNQVAGLRYTSMDMTGFPIHSAAHWVKKFTDNGYVVVMMDQFTRKKKNGCDEVYRRPVDVYGPGTPIETPEGCDSSVCAVVYVDEGGDMGYATFESNTGRTGACEFAGGCFESSFSGVISACVADSPAHTLVVHSGSDGGESAADRFRKRAGATRALGKRVDYKAVDAVTLGDSHVRETLRRQFGGCGAMTSSPETFVGLGEKRCASRAFAHLVHFVFRKDDTKLRVMEPPTLITPTGHLEVATEGLLQLDITGDGGLLGSLPGCCTAPGRRAFRQRLCRPSTDAEEIDRRLDSAEMAVGRAAELRRALAKAGDIEALHRKMRRPALFRPCDFSRMAETLRAVELASTMLYGERPGEHPCRQAVVAIETEVDTAACEYSEVTVFSQGRHVRYDAAREAAREADDGIRLLLGRLDRSSGAVHDPHFRASESKDGGIEITVTRKRMEAARRELSRDTAAVFVAGVEVTPSGLLSRAHQSKKTEVVVWSDSLDNALAEAVRRRIAVREIASELHAQACSVVGELIADAVYLCARELEDIDVAAACALAAERRSFVRPRVVRGESAVRATGLRHPVVEAMDGPHEYIGNDVVLDGGSRGLLLYGINGSGKSCLMKSLGIAVCMAQAGMFVCAESLEISPFFRLFTRIWNNDDIGRGMSTFTKEMVELKQVLVRGDSSSLVLGDELCSGTERCSATAIITAGIERMIENRCRFVLATHQHDVADIVGGAPEVTIKHMAVSLDNRGEIAYDRTLRDGRGASTYGVTVCRGLGMPPAFMESAAAHLRSLTGGDPDYAVSVKTSRYNKGVFMGACSRCASRAAVHTHHRDPQATASARVKNAAHNLEPLCVECHEMTHRHERGPSRMIQTTSGVVEIPIDIS